MRKIKQNPAAVVSKIFWMCTDERSRPHLAVHTTLVQCLQEVFHLFKKDLVGQALIGDLIVDRLRNPKSFYYLCPDKNRTNLENYIVQFA